MPTTTPPQGPKRRPTWELRADRFAALVQIDGVWHIDGHPVKAGDLVEIRRVRVGAVELGDDWYPAVIGDHGLLVELEGPGDSVPGCRSAEIRAAGLRTLALSLAEIRRV